MVVVVASDVAQVENSKAASSRGFGAMAWNLNGKTAGARAFFPIIARRTIKMSALSEFGVGIGIGAVLLAIYFIVTALRGGGDASESTESAGGKAPSTTPPRRKFTLSELRRYDGRDNRPVYVAVNDRVFDLSAKAATYGPGGAYGAFAGRDASRGLALDATAPPADEALPAQGDDDAAAALDYRPAGLEGLDDAQRARLAEWAARAARDGVEVGALRRLRVFSLADLRAFDGRKGAPIYLCVDGAVFDMSASPHFYGPEGPYGIFAGRDATRGLGKMSLDVKDVEPGPDGTVPTDDLAEDELQAMRDWRAKFEMKYDVVGRLE